MRTSVVWICVAMVVLVGAVGPVAAQSESDAMAEANRKLEEIVAEVNDFVGDVRFDEADVESLIELWPEFDELESLLDDGDDEELVDFDAVMADPDYRRWASSHGLDAEDWLRKSTRITMTLYREQMLQSMATAPQQYQQQMQMIEQQREQVGEETYLEMKAMLEASAAFAERMSETAGGFPQATAEEKAALNAHRDELMALMMTDDGEDDYGYDEYGYDDEYDE